MGYLLSHHTVTRYTTCVSSSTWWRNQLLFIIKKKILLTAKFIWYTIFFFFVLMWNINYTDTNLRPQFKILHHSCVSFWPSLVSKLSVTKHPHLRLRFKVSTDAANECENSLLASNSEAQAFKWNHNKQNTFLGGGRLWIMAQVSSKSAYDVGERQEEVNINAGRELNRAWS